MPDKKLERAFVTLALLLGSVAAHAQLPWSEETHQIAFGDFNGDGKTDLLYVARSSGASSGIALSNNAGPYTSSQTWASSFLGIAWHSGSTNPSSRTSTATGRPTSSCSASLKVITTCCMRTRRADHGDQPDAAVQSRRADLVRRWSSHRRG